VIHVESLHKEFDGGALPVLDGINFSVADGESMAIIGPSGCGKTTLLYILAGLTAYGTGTVTVNGTPLKGPSRDTAFILQDFGLLPWKTVRQNVCLGMKLRGVSRSDQDTVAAALLETLGLMQHRNYYPARLSGGEKQRVAIARALALNPDILLMDEPFSSLDTFTREKLQDTLLAIRQSHRLTTILVTHSIEEAVFLGDKIMVMSRRPARVRAIITNPGAGDCAFRQEDAFFTTCRSIRKMVEET
jgi:NitT/TauT family transport system ATP-binding protein